MVGELGLHRELELGGFPSDATISRPQPQRRSNKRPGNRASRNARARVS
jgi:hypothetical protein